MICKSPICNKEFTSSKGFKNFCSNKCRNYNLNLKQKEYWCNNSSEINDKHTLIVNSEIRLQKVRATWDKKLLTADFNSLKYDAKRRRIILEQHNKCGKCDLEKWFDTQLTLEIDHINGVNLDHRRENLIALCPNCHSITPTWRGRNRKSQIKVTDAQIIEASKNCTNTRQILLKIGLSAKADNYNRIKRILAE